MLHYLRESLHWMHLTFFKPITLVAAAGKFSRKQAIITSLKVYPVAAAIYSFLLITGGRGFELVGYSFDWEKAFRALVFGLLSELVFGLLGELVFGLLFGLAFGLYFGLLYGLSGGLVSGVYFYGLSGGLVSGVYFGLVGGLLFGLLFGLMARRVRGLLGLQASGLFFGLSGGLVGGFDKGLSEALNYTLAFLPTFFLLYFRAFYLLPYGLQYARTGKTGDPFRLLHRSPLYWDEVIATPLPYLKDWLVNLVKWDRIRGMKEILFVAENRPFQRKAALNALLTVAEHDLQLIHDVKGLATAANLLKEFPANNKALPKGLADARRRITTISTLAQDYQTRLTVDGQLEVLRELFGEMKSFLIAMAFTPTPVGTTFQPLIRRWMHIIETLGKETRKRLQSTALPNPYVAGNPLQQRDEQLFVGRRDILRALENYILNTNQRPSLFLYGRRRTGKSSTLLNLPRSQFEPVYIDCQDAKWHESDQAFCYNLVNEIYAALQQSEDVKGIHPPPLEQFAQNAFTRLDQYLDQFEKLAQQRGKRILLSFDEFEGLQESITNDDISKNVLGKLRNIIQHRERIVVLVSGSHRFDELTGLNWASYLINTRMLELSFLDEPSARELLTQPVPKLQYEGGVVEEIIRITHCQPYLLQAVASELVNYLNDQQRTTATMKDLEVTVEKVLVSAGSYFANTWKEGRSDEEQAMMLASAMGEAVDWAAHPTALRNLLNAEIVESNGKGYQLTIDLFRRWILKHKAPVLPKLAQH
ncbi:MAG: AAA family ATPase [Blastocatellia bacterium]|nr:AAA family ATPase [Blastocatellia bacterium]